jgi:hypothetical protein
MPFNKSHNLLVRGSNRCGGTKIIADFRLSVADLALCESRLNLDNLRWLEDGTTCLTIATLNPSPLIVFARKKATANNADAPR